MRGIKLYRRIREQATAIREFVAGVTGPIKTLDSTQSAGLVKVTLWHTNHLPDEGRFYPKEHIIAEHDVDTFVTASLELHYEPGYNPHSRNTTSQVQYITTQVLRPSGPYWWSTPGLRSRDSKHIGALTWNWSPEERIWTRPGVTIDEPEYAEH